MLGLLCFGSANVQAQNGTPEGSVREISINKTTGTKYRSDGSVNQNSGAVAKWVSTAIPGLSIVYNNGVNNQMNITDTGINPAWNNDVNHTYAIRLTGDDAVRYKLVGYKAHSTKGKLITANAPTAVNLTFTTTLTDTTISYKNGPEVKEMTFKNGTNRTAPTDEWSDGRIVVLLQPMKVRKVVYVIKEAGQVVHTTDSILVRVGAATIPASVTRPATQLTLETQNVEETTTQVVVNAVFAAPFDKVSQEAGHKYFFHDNNPTKHYLNFTAGQTAILTTTAKQYNNSYYWTFKGNPYTGVSIKNVSNNGFLKKSGNNVIADATITEDQVKWDVNFNNVTFGSSYTLPANTTGFTLKYPGHNDPLNVNGGTLNLSFWSTADNNSLFLVERAPDTRIVYVVKNEGTEVLRDTAYVNYGPATIPTALQRPLTQLTLAQADQVIDANTQEVVVNAVFSAPFDKASQEAGKKYLVRDQNNHYINHQEGTSYTLNTTKNFPLAYQWQFEGNPYTGVSVKSVATNGYLKKNANDAFVVAQAGIAASEAKWEVNFNKVTPASYYTIPANTQGFTLKDVAYGQALNVQGGTFKLTFWDKIDGNSLFFVEPVPEDLKEMVIADFQAVAAAGSDLPFVLKGDAYNNFKTLYDAAVNKESAVTGDEYAAIRAIVEVQANYFLPETGYYRIKNASAAGGYICIDPSKTTEIDMLYATQSATNAQRDASTIVYVEKQPNGKYLLKTSGKTAAAVASNNKTVYANNGAVQEVTMSLAGLGKGYLQIGTHNEGFLFRWPDYGNRVHTYTKDYNGTGQWSFEPATTLTLPLNAHGGKSYATACFPFPVTISTEGVTAYNVEPQSGTTKTNTTALSGTIPAGTPMLLVSETAVDSVRFAIGTDAPASTEPAGTFKGNYMVKTVAASAVMTLGRSNEAPTEVGFYKFTGTKVPPFRAYFNTADLTTLLAGANGFSINFDDLTTGVNGVEVQTESTGSVYDLAGRKVTKATKGLYIINGKKVIR